MIAPPAFKGRGGVLTGLDCSEGKVVVIGMWRFVVRWWIVRCGYDTVARKGGGWRNEPVVVVFVMKVVGCDGIS